MFAPKGSYLEKLYLEAEKLTENEIKSFLKSYLDMRGMNYSMLLLVSEDDLNYKPKGGRKRAITLRDLFSELPRVVASFVRGYKSGKRKFGGGHDVLPEKPTKKQILSAMEKTDSELFELITADKFNANKEIPFIGKDGKEKFTSKAIWMLWGIRNHENMHLGFIRRDFDGLDLDPSVEYVRYWFGG